MGNNVGLKLDKAHRSCFVGGNDIDGSTRLDGGRTELVKDPRISNLMSSFSEFKKHVLEAAAYSAIVSDCVGFRIEFEIIGNPTLLWTIPGATAVKVRQIFANDEAPPRITSVRGFYALFVILKDLWEHNLLPQRMDSSINDGEDESEAKSIIGDKEVEEVDVECPICMENEIEITPTCGHGLCQSCFQGWMERSSSCPTCRMEGCNDDAWVFAGKKEYPETQEEINKLIHSIHSFLVFLPRLETRWENDQRRMRERMISIARRTSSTNHSNVDIDDEDSLHDIDDDDAPISDYLQSGALLEQSIESYSLDAQEQAQLEFALALSLRCT